MLCCVADVLCCLALCCVVLSGVVLGCIADVLCCICCVVVLYCIAVCLELS